MASAPNGFAGAHVVFGAVWEERNDVVLSVAPGGVFEISDQSAPLEAGEGCAQLDPHRASCTVPVLLAVSISLFDGDDSSIDKGWKAPCDPAVGVLERQPAAGRAGDTLELSVSRPPTTDAAALELAREQFSYAPDIVQQGSATSRRSPRSSRTATPGTSGGD